MPDLSTSDLVQRVRDLLNDFPWETTSTTTTTSTTVAVPDGALWAQGDIGEWQTGTVGYEQFYVQSVSVNNLTTVRGYAGTTAETHTSGDRVVKLTTPGVVGYSGRQIQRAVTEAMNFSWPYIFKPGTVTLSGWSTSTIWHNLNALTLDVLKVVQLYGSSNVEVGRFGAKNSGKSYSVDLNLPTALVASGKGIRFPGGYFHATNDITITDRRALTGTADIVDSVQFPEAEALTYGAVSRMLQAAEVGRVGGGTNLDTANTVAVGARMNTASWFEEQFRNKLQVLNIRLNDYYQPDRKWR
jgi:hypothetical protein